MKTQLKFKKINSYQNLAKEVCKELQQRGFAAYWVGGAVRDLLLKKKNYDIDIATSAEPQKVKAAAKSLGLKIYTVGEKFGTIGLVTKAGNIEVTTFRTEGKYSDQRRPDRVSFAADVEEDSRRRDFTINALYYDPVKQELLDFHNGLADIQKRRLRFVGEPVKRIKEDPLRLLRAVRLAADLGLKISGADLSAVQKYSSLIKKVSAQRIKIELDKMFNSPSYIQAVLLLDKTFLLKSIFPEVDNLKKTKQSKDYHAEGNVFNHTLNALRFAKDYDLQLRYAVFFHDLGKPYTAKRGERKGRDHISFHGHAQKGEQLFLEVAKRLVFTRQEKRRISWLIKHHMDLLGFDQVKQKTALKWAKNDDFGDLIKLRIADSSGGIKTDLMGRVVHKDLKDLNKLYKQWQRLNILSKKNFLNGEDVMRELKIKPGQRVGWILNKVLEEKIFGRVKNKKEALQYIKSLDNKK